MAYGNPQTWLVALGAAYNGGNTGDALFAFTVPTGMEPFTLHGITQRISTQFNTTGSPQATITRTPSGGAEATLATCTAFATGNTVGTVKYDATPAVTATTNEFHPGDILRVEKSTLATTAGAVDILLHIGGIE